MPHSPWVWVAVALVLVVLALVVLGLGRRRVTTLGRHATSRPHRDAFRQEGVEPTPRKRFAVVVNPNKVPDTAAAEATIRDVAGSLDWDVDIAHTTETDTGEAQARAALASGAAVVGVLGGDGTVRNVAEALAGTRTPMGLLPAGTGNLLARNLDMPIGGLEAAVRTALTGVNRHVDIGRVRLQPTDEGARTAYVFLVMAGMGFDAAIMNGANDGLKAKVGWGAYVVAGLRHLFGERFTVTVTMDGGHSVDRHARSVLVGNCGRLQAGVNLMPDARIDDGILDAVVLAPRSLTGWMALSASVIRKSEGSSRRLDRFTSTSFEIHPGTAQEVELDGDPIGRARFMRVDVVPRGLIVRMPGRLNERPA